MNLKNKSRNRKRTSIQKENKIEFETLEPRQLLCTFRAALQTAIVLGNSGTDNVQIQFQGHQQSGFVSGGSRILVTSSGDQPDSNPSDGVCNSGPTNSNPVNTINVNSPLPAIQHSTKIEATPFMTSASALVPAAVTVRNNSPSSTNISGLIVTGDYARVSGLKLSGFDHGIVVAGTFNEVIGNELVDNRFNGALVSGTNNDIGRFFNGSTHVRKGNLISGNVNGVMLTGTGSLNLVYGNFIGTNQAGSGPDANSRIGVVVTATAGRQTIQNNVISGNAWYGVNSATRSGVVVDNNMIGVDATGVTGVANGRDGVVLGAIGGNPQSVVSNNVISANVRDGIHTREVGVNITDNNIGVDVNGSFARGNRFGILASTGSALFDISDNLISGNEKAGIFVYRNGGFAQSIISGNKIGTNEGGDRAIPNDTGIVLNRQADFIRVGAVQNSLNDADGNTISGNLRNGISITGGTQTGPFGPIQVSINQNLIGVSQNTAGQYVSVPNGVTGIYVSDGQTRITNNQIGNNGNSGISLVNPSGGNQVDNNQVAGNLIGVMGNYLTQSFTIASNRTGIYISSSNNNTIGSVTNVQYGKNYIAANTSIGVSMVNADRNWLTNNDIGTTAAFGFGNGNGYAGVFISGGDFNSIGGRDTATATSGLGNFINDNGGPGIVVVNGEGNEIHRNWIGRNTHLDIDLVNGNNNQKSPTVTNVRPTGSGLNYFVSGTLNGVRANTPYVIELFSSQSSSGGGDQYHNRMAFTTNGAGNLSFNMLATISPALVGRYVSATATMEGATSAIATQGDTSEFSNGIQIPFVPRARKMGSGDVGFGTDVALQLEQSKEQSSKDNSQFRGSSSPFSDLVYQPGQLELKSVAPLSTVTTDRFAGTELAREKNRLPVDLLDRSISDVDSLDKFGEIAMAIVPSRN